MAGTFVVHLDPSTGYRFTLVDGNGHVVTTSEWYESHGDCLEGVDWVRRNAADVFLDDPIVRPPLHSVPSGDA